MEFFGVALPRKSADYHPYHLSKAKTDIDVSDYSTLG